MAKQVIANAKEKMKKAIQALFTRIASIRAGRANASLSRSELQLIIMVHLHLLINLLAITVPKHVCLLFNLMTKLFLVILKRPF